MAFHRGSECPNFKVEINGPKSDGGSFETKTLTMREAIENA
jgi:hypothetical protein